MIGATVVGKPAATVITSSPGFILRAVSTFVELASTSLMELRLILS